MKRILFAILVWAFVPTLSFAQSPVKIGTPTTNANTNNLVVNPQWPLPVGGKATAAAPTYTEGGNSSLSFDLSGNLRTTSSGGGGGGAVTIADGADVTQGAIADTVSSAGGVGTLSAKLRLMTTQFNTLNTTVATSANQTTMGTNQTAVQGPVPAGAATATKFNMAGGEFRSTLPTLTDGQQGPTQLNARGSTNVALNNTGTAVTIATTLGNDLVSNTTPALATAAYGQLFDNTQWVRQRGDTTGGLWSQGAVASGAADSGNPVKVGGKYNATKPTFTDGQRGDFQIGTRGSLGVTLYGADITTPVGLNGTQSDGFSSAVSLYTTSFGALFNSSTYDRPRSINGALAAGTGTAAVAIAPTSAASGGITPVPSTAVESSHILKASAGNFYSLTVTTGGTAGYVMLFNATSAPADGAVTPVECVTVAANSTVSINYNSGPPSVYTTGITWVFSSTGCFTKTASATAFGSGKVQ